MDYRKIDREDIEIFVGWVVVCGLFCIYMMV